MPRPAAAKPSTNTCPPFGPAEAPARTCNVVARSSGSSGRASRSLPLSTRPVLFVCGSVLNSSLLVVTVTCCFPIVAVSLISSEVRALVPTITSVFSNGANPLAVTFTVYLAAGRSSNENTPRSSVVVLTSEPSALISVTFVAVITPPSSSISWPRSAPLCCCANPGLAKKTSKLRTLSSFFFVRLCVLVALWLSRLLFMADSLRMRIKIYFQFSSQITAARRWHQGHRAAVPSKEAARCSTLLPVGGH